MTVSKWRVYSREVISEVLAANKGADIKTLRKALREAYPFGERKYTPYKIWLEECRKALAPAKWDGTLFEERSS